MPIWLEAILGLLAITPCVAACWREEKLVEWEDKMRRRWRQRKERSR